MTENQNIKRKIDLSPFKSEKFLRAWFNYLRLVASICLAYMFSCYLLTIINGEITSNTITKNALTSILGIGILNILFYGKNITPILLIQGAALYLTINQPNQMFFVGFLTQLVLVAYLVAKYSYELAKELMKCTTKQNAKFKEPQAKEVKTVVLIIATFLNYIIIGSMTLFFMLIAGGCLDHTSRYFTF